jgi:hypothetical protein
MRCTSSVGVATDQRSETPEDNRSLAVRSPWLTDRQPAGNSTASV